MEKRVLTEFRGADEAKALGREFLNVSAHDGLSFQRERIVVRKVRPREIVAAHPRRGRGRTRRTPARLLVRILPPAVRDVRIGQLTRSHQRHPAGADVLRLDRWPYCTGAVARSATG